MKEIYKNILTVISKTQNSSDKELSLDVIIFFIGVIWFVQSKDVAILFTCVLPFLFWILKYLSYKLMLKIRISIKKISENEKDLLLKILFHNASIYTIESEEYKLAAGLIELGLISDFPDSSDLTIHIERNILKFLQQYYELDKQLFEN